MNDIMTVNDNDKRNDEGLRMTMMNQRVSSCLPRVNNVMNHLTCTTVLITESLIAGTTKHHE